MVFLTLHQKRQQAAAGGSGASAPASAPSAPTPIVRRDDDPSAHIGPSGQKSMLQLAQERRLREARAGVAGATPAALTAGPSATTTATAAALPAIEEGPAAVPAATGWALPAYTARIAPSAIDALRRAQLLHVHTVPPQPGHGWHTSRQEAGRGGGDGGAHGAPRGPFPAPCLSLGDARLPAVFAAHLARRFGLAALTPAQQSAVPCVLRGESVAIVGPPGCGHRLGAVAALSALVARRLLRCAERARARGQRGGRDGGHDSASGGPLVLYLCPSRDAAADARDAFRAVAFGWAAVGAAPNVGGSLFEPSVHAVVTTPQMLLQELDQAGAAPPAPSDDANADGAHHEKDNENDGDDDGRGAIAESPAAAARRLALHAAQHALRRVRWLVLDQADWLLARPLDVHGARLWPALLGPRVLGDNGNNRGGEGGQRHSSDPRGGPRRRLEPRSDDNGDNDGNNDGDSSDDDDGPTRQTVLLASAAAPLKPFCATFLRGGLRVVVQDDAAAWTGVVHCVEFVAEATRLQHLASVVQRTPPPVLVVAARGPEAGDATRFLTGLGVDATNAVADAVVRGRGDVLVATDGALAGVENLPPFRHVISFSLPREDAAGALTRRARFLSPAARATGLCLATTFVSRRQTEGAAADIRQLLLASGQSVPEFLAECRSAADREQRGGGGGGGGGRGAGGGYGRGGHGGAGDHR